MLAFAAAMAMASNVSVSTYGEPVTALLADISKQTGLDLKASPEVAKDVLTCVVKDVPSGELLDKVAKADGAMWRHDGPTWWLQRPSRLADNQRIDEDRECRAAIQKELDHEIPDGDALMNEGRAPGLGASPYLVKVAAYEIGGAELGSMPIGQRRFYTDNPGIGDGQLPPECQRLFAPILSEAASSMHQPANEFGMTISAIREGPEQVTVYAAMYFRQSMCGSATYRISATVPQSGGPDRPGNSTKPFPATDPPVIVLPTQDEALHPEKNDPIAFSWGRYAAAIARQEHGALVAALPDEPFDFSSQRPRSETNTRSLRNALAMQTTIDESTPGWVAIKPKFPTWARSEFVDRSVLGRFIREGETKGGASIDELAAFASAARTFSTESLAMSWTETAESVLAMLLNRNELPMLRFYEDLTQAQRDTLRANGTVQLQNLGGDAVKDLEDWVTDRPFLAGFTRGSIRTAVRTESEDGIHCLYSKRDLVQTRLDVDLPYRNQFLDPGAIGVTIASASHRGGYVAASKYRPAASEYLGIDIQTGGIRRPANLMGSWATDGNQWRALKDLPKDLLHEIEQAAQSTVYYEGPRTIKP